MVRSRNKTDQRFINMHKLSQALRKGNNPGLNGIKTELNELTEL